jgi:hypothetical protein
MYVGGVKTGFYSINGLYLPVFSVIYMLFFLQYINSRKTRLLTVIFSIMTVLISLAILKRTLILVLILGLILFLVFNFKARIILSAIFILLVSSILFYIFFYSEFQKTLVSRESRFNKDYDITQEGRITENFYVFDLMKRNPHQIFFGTGEIFNDRKYISRSFYDEDREVHSSFTRIFWNGGLVGLGLFLYFYYTQVMITSNGFLNSKKTSRSLRTLFSFGLTLIILRFLNDFSSGITYLGFNSFCYLLIGNILFIANTIVRIPLEVSNKGKSPSNATRDALVETNLNTQ